MKHWLWSGVAVAAAMALGACGSSNVAPNATSAAVSPLTRNIQAFFHALSVEQVHCGPRGAHGRRSCQVEFTDNYGEWWVTIIVKGSRVISDPGGVADWLCANACSNPPPMTANTGNPRTNPGGTGASASTANRGQTGVTGIGGVVRTPPRPKPKPKPPPVPVPVTGSTGVGTGSTGVVNPTGSTGVVKNTGNTGVVSGSGNTGRPGGATGAGSTGVVYGTGSTGPGG
ncbi:MAG TPA: hypothetical protein VG295_10450 [Solirubrobacteraceae bacterium]|nr:hypothetical protein [Solirubrobacteraceae bacterium]